VDEPGAVDGDALALPSGVQHRDVELRRRGQQMLSGSGSPVAEQSAGPTRQDGRKAPRVRRQGIVADGVDARVERQQAFALHPPPHRVLRKAQLVELRP
jgi:hypothetical protein